MKRVELLRQLARAAREAGVTLEYVRAGGRHDIYRWGGVLAPVPRHAEVNEMTARAILRDVKKGAQ